MKCRRSVTVEERFWTKVRKTDGCWYWTGATDYDGYGIFNVDQEHQSERATHVAYELVYGVKVTKGSPVRHSCDNPPCIRPEHLTPGTAKQNGADKVGRDRQAKGKTHGRCLLTEEQVKAIRDSYSPWVITLSWLAKHYGISVRQVHRIVQGKTWKHLS